MGHDTGEKPMGGDGLVADADVARARAVLIVGEFISIDTEIGFTTDVLGFFDVDFQGQTFDTVTASRNVKVNYSQRSSGIGL